ncbi:hypothetical protein PTTG_09692, partial [Puccinia triticina 1-1 BBBD Race 1]
MRITQELYKYHRQLYRGNWESIRIKDPADPARSFRVTADGYKTWSMAIMHVYLREQDFLLVGRVGSPGNQLAVQAQVRRWFPRQYAGLTTDPPSRTAAPFYLHPGCSQAAASAARFRVGGPIACAGSQPQQGHVASRWWGINTSNPCVYPGPKNSLWPVPTSAAGIICPGSASQPTRASPQALGVAHEGFWPPL